jgi:probable HAF family extracellular repeat protein
VGTANPVTSMAEAFRWTQATGMVGLGSLDPTDPVSVANDISANGSIIVGGTYSPEGTQAYRWQNGTMTALGELPGGEFASNATAVSANGVTIVGYSASDESNPGDYEAFRWKNNNMIGLGDLPGGIFESYAYGVSADGEVVIGDSTSDLGNEAFVWDRINGMRKLQDVLENDYGLDLTGWSLRYATGISDDGMTITGWGINPYGRADTWVARLDKPIITKNADLDNDNDVDDDDVEIFEKCSTGPNIPYDSGNLPPDCTLVPDAHGFIDADYDADLDVDQNDFADFQLCYSGEGVPPDLGCKY